MRKALFSTILASLALAIVLPLLAFSAAPVLAACEGKPNAVRAKVLPGEFTGQVYIWWNPAANVDHYNVLIGTKSNNYPMGALNIGDSNLMEYNVRFLDVRRKYFFRIVSVCGDHETWSNEVYSYPRKRPF